MSATAGAVQSITNGADPSQNGTQVPTSWYADADKGYVELKGWKGPQDVLESYRGLERIQRTPRERLLELPEKDDDREGWGKVWGRLGRPENPEGYQLPAFTVTDGQIDLSPEYRKWAHEVGLSNKAAKQLAEKFMGHAQNLRTQADEKFSQETQLATERLKREWGQEYDRNIGLARKVVDKVYQAVGYKGAEEMQADLLKIENQLGHERFMKFFATLGRGMGEASFVDGDSTDRGGAFGMTPDAARAKFEAVQSDTAFMNKVMAGDKAANEEFNRLAELAAQGMTMGAPSLSGRPPLR